MSNCPKCGYPIAPDETACTNCGEPVENTNEENVSPENIENVTDNSDVENIEELSESVDTVSEVEESSEEQVSEEISAIGEAPIEETPSIEAMPIEAPVDPSVAEVPMMPATPDASIPVAPTMAPGVTEMPPIPTAPIVPETPMPMTPTEVAIPVAPAVVETPMPVPTPMAPTMVEVPVMPEVAPITPMAPESLAMMPEMMEVPTQDVLQAPSLPVETPTIAPTNEPFQPTAKGPVFSKIVFLLVFLLSVVAIALLAFFILKMFSNENVVQNNKIPEASREYHYEGFNLYIEEKDKDENKIHAEVYDGEFYIGSDTWSAIMTLQSGTYNSLLSNKSQLVDYFKGMGYEATEPIEKEISGTSFVKMEVMMGSKNVLVAYAKANGTKLYGIVLENEAGEYTDEDLRVLGTLIATSKYVGPKYSLPEGFQLDLFKETFMVAE